MNVSSVFGPAATQYAAPSATPGAASTQSLKDWKGLGDSLASGDLAAAKNFFDDFQKLNSSLFSGAASKTQLGKDLASLASALNSQDLKSARDAFTSVEKDLSPEAVQSTLNEISSDRTTGKMISMVLYAISGSTTSQSSNAAQSTSSSDISAGDESTSTISTYA